MANLVDTEEEKAVALLHDVVEDTEITLEDLVSLGIPKDVVEAVAVITKQRGEDYFKYIKRVKQNTLARKVKHADLLHNADLNRLLQPIEKDFKRREKYLKAIEMLENEVL